MSKLLDVMNTIALSIEYKWPDEFAMKEIKKSYQEAVDNIEIDWYTINKQQAKRLGFKKYSDTLWLIPAYLYNKIPKDFVVVGESGEKIKKEDIDVVFRHGCIEYGIEIK